MQKLLPSTISGLKTSIESGYIEDNINIILNTLLGTNKIIYLDDYNIPYTIISKKWDNNWNITYKKLLSSEEKEEADKELKQLYYNLNFHKKDETNITYKGNTNLPKDEIINEDNEEHVFLNKFITNNPLIVKTIDIQEFEKDDLIEIQNSKIEITPLGRILIRNIAMTFDQYLLKSNKLFSRTI